MNSKAASPISKIQNSTISTPITPKRRRLGTGRILRPKNVLENNDSLINSSPIASNVPPNVRTQDRCESPHLPCNQVEYLHDSVINSSCEIPCSPGVLEIEQWESLVVSTSKFNEVCERSQKVTAGELDDIPDDIMLHSKLDQFIHDRVEKSFKNNIDECFDSINQSICNLNDVNKNKTLLFETKDSFLLDIKETCIEEKAALEHIECIKSDIDAPNNGFYGLPMITKGLFKSYRNIEQLYDWQEECLNLSAIKERRNLIYALPTSGGKTLVAEILMLREVLNSKRNALFILPFVAIVQEKIWSLSPFAIQLDFLVEEYAAGKGHIPPKKRRRKNSIYIATIEKALALIRSLIELNRLQEVGLIVVDELHLIGEKGRGGTLETLLSTVIFTNQNIQIVGMSATIGNLDELAQYLRAEVYQRQFRPVELVEYVKLGEMLHRIVSGPEGVEVVPERKLAYDVSLQRTLVAEYSAAAIALDPDRLGGLVSEVVPAGSCLVFCPTKRNCENVAALLCKLQRREMSSHRGEERQALRAALRAEGADEQLARCVQAGVAYHHAGLAGDERALLEHAFRSGVISVLCCTSTLAAGVNLPAQRVLVRAPRVGRDFLSLGAYRQMAGRAGRAGVCRTGESIIICSAREWPQLQLVLRGGLAPARSALRRGGAGGEGGEGGQGAGVAGLLLSGVALGLATRRPALRSLLSCTLMAITDAGDGATDIKTLCDDTLRSLIEAGALEVVSSSQPVPPGAGEHAAYCVYDDSELAVSTLGRAAIKGCMELGAAARLVRELRRAARALVLLGGLHLLYLVTPPDAALRPDYRHYYSLYCELDEEGVQTAKILGITEMNAIRMMTGKPITNVPESVLCRFYIALMLHDLWKQVPFAVVAQKYMVARGTVQALLAAAGALAAGAARLCAELSELWPFRALLAELAPRLQHAAAPELAHLMELPAVKKARAIQLMRAGYKRIEDLAKASADDLVAAVSHLSKTTANQLISAAKMMLIEKVENLRAEAEDVMEELNV